MNYSIVDAEKRHVAEIEKLEKACFSMPWTAEQIEGQLPGDNHVFIAAESDKGLMGYVGMMYILDEGYISNVAVSPDFRRQHVGSALIEELLKRASSLELSFVSLEVRKSNLPARALYSSFGFADAGCRKNYYDLPKEDAIIMTKYLK